MRRWRLSEAATGGPIGDRFNFLLFFLNPTFQFELTLEDETASGGHTSTKGLGSAPEQGQTIGEHALQARLPAYRFSRGGFGATNSSRRWTGGLGT